MTRREKFATSIAVLAAAFNREMIPAAIEGYWIALQALDDEELALATKRALAESKFMPAPSELLAFAGRARNIPAEAALCWQAVRRAIDEHDWSVASIDFGPRVNAVVRNLGGWDTLCTAKLSELDSPGWLRKRFEEVYGLLAETPADMLNSEPIPGGQEARKMRGARNVLVAIAGQPGPRRQLPSRSNPVSALIQELAEAKSV